VEFWGVAARALSYFSSDEEVFWRSAVQKYGVRWGVCAESCHFWHILLRKVCFFWTCTVVMSSEVGYLGGPCNINHVCRDMQCFYCEMRRLFKWSALLLHSDCNNVQFRLVTLFHIKSFCSVCKIAFWCCMLSLADVLHTTDSVRGIVLPLGK